jgi:hypothetical protein
MNHPKENLKDYRASEAKVLHYATKKTSPKVYFLCVFLEP